MHHPTAAALLAVLLAQAAHAQVPTGAEVVLLRKDCAASAHPAVCMQTMAALNAWLPTRTPADHPVLVDVGPGDWGPFVCNGEDNVALRGAGREVTRIVAHGPAAVAMTIDNCSELDVDSLTAHASYIAVQWEGGGSSTWSDTDLLAGGVEFPEEEFFSIGWYDAQQNTDPCEVDPIPVHYFFGSRVRALGNATFNWGFQARCGEHWFFGGEVLATHETEYPGGVHQAAVLVETNGIFQAFGTAIRSLAGPTTNTPLHGPLPPVTGGMHAVFVDGLGTFHSHGGIVSAIADGSGLNVDVTGLQTSSGARLAHTPGSAFVVKAGPGGAATRLNDGSGTAQSPFLWQQASEPPRAEPGVPTSPFVSSAQGADLFVETDCQGSGSCTGGGDPHMMVYSTNCTGAGGPWFDLVTGSCRAN